MTSIFIEPSDVWLFRDGRPFAAADQTRAASIFPPTPRTIQGVLRSAFIAQQNKRFDGSDWDDVFKKQLGTTQDFGTLKMKGVVLAGRTGQVIQKFFPHPADLVEFKDGWQVLKPQGALQTNWNSGLRQLLPTNQPEPEKFEFGWLPEEGLRKYLAGVPRKPTPSGELFEREARFGIEIESQPKRTAEGKLYQVEFIRLKDNYGLLVEFEGLPFKSSGLLQLGGEAKAGSYKTVAENLSLTRDNPLKTSAAPLQFKLYLATPAIFKQGWLPDWIDANTLQGEWKTLPVTLVSAALHKPQSIGGRDISLPDQQRAMHRAVPAGSVYFFETAASAADVFNVFDGQCVSDVDAQIGYGLSYVGGW